MESKRLIIGIGQGVWMLNPRMLAMGNQTQIALLMAEYDRYVSEKTGVALVAGKYVLKIQLQRKNFLCRQSVTIN